MARRGLQRRRGRATEPATALARYALLEALGDYHDGSSARPREVVVKFGRASLTLLGPDDTPLAHWALASLRRLDGPSKDAALRLAPDPDGDERLTVRDPQMIAAIEAVCADLDSRPVSGRAWLRMGAWATAALGSVALLVFVILPAAAERFAPLVPPEQARRLGETAVTQVAAAMGGGAANECTDPDGRAALDRLTRRLTAQADLTAPVSVRVFRAPQVNAFAAPGGQVAILSGLIENADAPEEVAAVLAHELGHVAARDPLREALRRAGTAGVLGLATGDLLGGALAASVAEAAIAASYSREAEEAADAYAHRLFARAGLPASALAGFFERIARGDEAEGMLRHFASHPDLADRAARAREADVTGGAPFTPALSDADWIALRQISG